MTNEGKHFILPGRGRERERIGSSSCIKIRYLKSISYTFTEPLQASCQYTELVCSIRNLSELEINLWSILSKSSFTGSFDNFGFPLYISTHISTLTYLQSAITPKFHLCAVKKLDVNLMSKHRRKLLTIKYMTLAV